MPEPRAKGSIVFTVFSMLWWNFRPAGLDGVVGDTGDGRDNGNGGLLERDADDDSATGRTNCTEGGPLDRNVDDSSDSGRTNGTDGGTLERDVDDGRDADDGSAKGPDDGLLVRL